MTEGAAASWLTLPAGRALIVGLIAILGAVAIRTGFPAPEPNPAEIVALVAPRHVAANERVALYLGFGGTSESARAVVRICGDATCPVERVEPLAATDEVAWSWIANASLPTGRYQATVYLQQATPWGPRTTDEARWTLEVDR